ncbi:MAG: glycosyltransferase family 4 protein [Candidatus Pacearchaeota archaeon]
MLTYSFYEYDNRVKRYAETLVKRGDHVDVIALRKDFQSSQDVVNGVYLYRLQKRNRDEKNKFSYLIRIFKFLVKSMLFLSKKHLDEHYDLIHVHNIPDFLVFATIIPKLKGAKIILDIHDILPEFYVSKFNTHKKALFYKLIILIEKMSVSFSDHIIVSNHLWQKTLISRSVKNEKCTVILNYPNSSLSSKQNQNSECVNNEKFLLFYPGSLNWHQGVDIAVRSFAIVKDQIPGSEFHIYGDGPSKNYLLDLVKQLNMEKCVIFKNPVPHDRVSDILLNANLGIVPKRADVFGNEAFSTKILEFMALGIPVLVSDTKIDKFYFNESLVMFFKSGDEKDLAEKIISLYKDKELREKLIMNSLNYVEENNLEKK